MKSAIFMVLFALALAVAIAYGVHETLDFAHAVQSVFKAKIAEAEGI